MTPFRIPAAPAIGTPDAARRLQAARSDRREFLTRAAGLGLALPTLGGAAIAAGAQEPTAMPHEGHVPPEGTVPAGYVGSDPQSPSTGAEIPVPASAQPFAVYDPVLPTVQPGPKEITVVAKDATVMIAQNIPYAGWTFDGTIPGKVLRVVEGDQIDFTFKVDPTASTAHSLDFHSAKTPPDKNYKTIAPGEAFSWSFSPPHAGAYMYHCGTPPVLMHIAAGMYGAMIVDPKEGWPPAQELVFVQSDFYLEEGANGTMVPSYDKMLGHGDMDYVAFNGYANQYVENPITVRVGEPIRIFVVNAGPNVWSSFHVVGAIFDRACVNANPRNELFGLQSITIGPGDGACVEFTLEEPGEYVAVNHAFGHAAHGAIAVLHAVQDGTLGVAATSVASPPASPAAAAGAAITVEGFDIGWRFNGQDTLGGPISVPVSPGTTISLPNTGVAEHDFVVDEFGIQVVMPIGQSVEATIPADAAPGEYRFYCSVPGHEAAGMVGTLIIS